MEKDQELPGPAEERNNDGGGTGSGDAATLEPDSRTETSGEGARAETFGGPAGEETFGGPGAETASTAQFAPPGGTSTGGQPPYQRSSYTSPGGNPYAQIPPAVPPMTRPQPAGSPPGYPPTGGMPVIDPAASGQTPGQAPGEAPGPAPGQEPDPAQAGYSSPAAGQPGGYGPGYPGPAYPGQDQGYPGQQGFPPYPGQPGYPGPGYPGYQGYPGYPAPGYPGGQPQQTPGKALGIAALCVAGSGLLISWIPFLNIFTFVLGVVALGLGIAGLVKGLRARNVARVLSGIALGVAVVSMIIAGSVNSMLLDSFRQTGMGQIEAEQEPAVPYSGTPDEGDSPDDYTYGVSDIFWEEILAAPAYSAGEAVQVGDYTVTLASMDRDASAEVQERDPQAGPPDYGYTMFEFNAVYNGDGVGRGWLDLAPEFIGADQNVYSVLGCSLDIGMGGFDQPDLAKGDTLNFEFCMDLPEEAVGADSRVGLRTVLAEDYAPTYWRLP